MKKNFTLSIDEDLLQKMRVHAVLLKTRLHKMVCKLHWLLVIALCACSQETPEYTPKIAEQEFIRTCGGIADYDAARSNAKQSGWDSVRTDSYPPLEAVIDQSILEDSYVQGGFQTLHGNWAKDVLVYNVSNHSNRYAYKKSFDDRDFYLVLLTNKVGAGHEQYGCFLYDFQEGYEIGLPDESNVIAEWLDAKPTQNKFIEGLTSVALWDETVPALSPDLLAVGAVNIEDTRKIRKEAGYYGRGWFALSTVHKPYVQEAD